MMRSRNSGAICYRWGWSAWTLGYASLHLRRRLGEQATPIRQALDRFAAALADDYGASARGEPPEHMRATGEQLLEALEQHGNDPVEQRLTAGLIERLTMSLERQAERSRLARER